MGDACVILMLDSLAGSSAAAIMATGTDDRFVGVRHQVESPALRHANEDGPHITINPSIQPPAPPRGRCKSAERIGIAGRGD